MYIFEITISSEKSFEFICKEGEMAESDEELFITQNTFITEEITESDVISEGGSDIEEMFDRWVM